MLEIDLKSTTEALLKEQHSENFPRTIFFLNWKQTNMLWHSDDTLDIALSGKLLSSFLNQCVIHCFVLAHIYVLFMSRMHCVWCFILYENLMCYKFATALTLFTLYKK